MSENTERLGALLSAVYALPAIKNAPNILAGTNISLSQSGNNLTINAAGGGATLLGKFTGVKLGSATLNLSGSLKDYRKIWLYAGGTASSASNFYIYIGGSNGNMLFAPQINSTYPELFVEITVTTDGKTAHSFYQGSDTYGITSNRTSLTTTNLTQMYFMTPGSITNAYVYVYGVK